MGDDEFRKLDGWEGYIAQQIVAARSRHKVVRERAYAELLARLQRQASKIARRYHSIRTDDKESLYYEAVLNLVKLHDGVRPPTSLFPHLVQPQADLAPR